MVGMFKGIEKLLKNLVFQMIKAKVIELLTNIGNDGGQEVPHLHFHLFGGEKIGKMVE